MKTASHRGFRLFTNICGVPYEAIHVILVVERLQKCNYPIYYN